MLYKILLLVLRGIIRTFFRTIDVVGQHNIPKQGPVVFVGNHPNSLLDPAVIVVTCRRQVSFAAKNTLFETPILRLVLRGFGAVPIFRRQDHAGPVSNTSTFSALLGVLRKGGAFGIFPEGVSHADSHLAPLKTGAARLVADALQEGLPVTLIPCGLTYRKRTRLRARVLVQFGEPVSIPPKPLQDEDAQKDFVSSLTANIDASLRALTINVSDFDTLRVLDGVRRLYCPQSTDISISVRMAITQRLIEHYEKLKEHEDVAALYRDVEIYLFRLRALYLVDGDVSDGVSRLQKAKRVVLYGVFILFWLPLALPGLLFHMPVIYLAVVLGEGLVRHKDQVATYKVVFAIGLYVISVGGMILMCFAFISGPDQFIWSAMVCAVYVISARAALQVLDRQWIFGHGLYVFAMVLNMKKELSELVAVRAELRQRVLELVDVYLADDEERLIAKEDNP
jgi:glycerol-3-phosphate O-acyltransferase / dihydroxyacetone phosphate acyltransferase